MDRSIDRSIDSEFSFTIEDDIYIRYQCFADQAALTSAIQKRQVCTITIFFW